MKTRIVMVMSADGVIAKSSNHNPTEWTSKEDQELYKKITKEAGVMIFGQSTYDAIGMPLPGRLNIVLTRENRQDIPGTLEHKQGDLKLILEDLAKRGFKLVIIGGGTIVNSRFLEAGLVDELQLTIEPKLFGAGLRLFDQIDVNIDLELIEVVKLNDNTLNLIYKIKKTSNL